MKKNSGLGMGLSSLIPPKSIKVNAPGKDNVFYIEVNKIRANAKQPRQDFDQKGIEELAASIKKYGILQPILVTKVQQETERGLDVDYEVIAGERRLRAARFLGLPQIPVIVKTDFDEDRVRLEVALIENVQRQDLNPLEEAEAYVRLASEFGMTQLAIAEKVSKSREVIANTIRLLDLPSEMQASLRQGQISRTHARALLAFRDDPTRQREVFQQVLAGNITTNDIETSAKAFKAARGEVRNVNVNPRFDELQENLTRNLGTPVIIKSGNVGGSIQIKFADLEQLNAIAKTILG